MSERDAFKKLLEDFNKIEDSVGKNDIEVEVASPIKVRLLAELKARQLKDPKTEVMVVKNNKVIVIDKKDLPKYVDDGWALAEAHGGKHTTTGRSMTKGEEKEKERLVKGMKKNKADFKKRYGKDADAVMYATATKKAMAEGTMIGGIVSFKGQDLSEFQQAYKLYKQFMAQPRPANDSTISMIERFLSNDEVADEISELQMDPDSSNYPSASADDVRTIVQAKVVDDLNLFSVEEYPQLAKWGYKNRPGEDNYEHNDLIEPNMATEAEEDTTIEIDVNKFIPLAGDSKSDKEGKNPKQVKVDHVVIQNPYDDADEGDEDDGLRYVKVQHDGPAEIYTDSGFTKAISKIVGFEVDFTEEGLQQDGLADMEGIMKNKGVKEGQSMSFEQMDKIYSGLKNAIDLYEKLVGDIEDPMADFPDDLGSDIVNYTKQGPLSSAPEIKNIENLSQSQMLTLASMARQAIGLAQSDVGANVTDIPAAEEFVKKLEVAIKGVKELDTKDLQRFPANVMKGKKKEKGGTDRDKAYFKMQQKRKEKQTAEAELAVKKQDLGGMLVDRFNAFFRKATPEEIKAMAQLLDYKTRDEDKEFVKIEKEDIEETMFAENDKECPPGQYYCNDEQKCKPIPAGHEVEPDGNLKPIQKDAKQVLIDFQAKINEFAKNLGVTPKMLFAGLIEKNPELADNPIAKKIGEYSKALMQSK